MHTHPNKHNYNTANTTLHPTHKKIFTNTYYFIYYNIHIIYYNRSLIW